MADNNKNPRRTIWLSETEPLSHYDIWLSKNQHLNSDGESVSDSGVLRSCDYIFKVWDCDNWYPIIGFNSTAVNKIDTVLNTTYIDSHGESHTSYREFHVPLFTNPESSPSELFDSGTVGLVINLYVTYEEWQNIFEGDSFTNAFEQYFTTLIYEGDININTYVDPAEVHRIGGIWADEFTMELMVPDLYEGYSSSLINKTRRWLAKAKYKYNHNTNGNEDYNLYVDAKTIINIINQYQEDNPDEPGITPGGGATIDPEVLYRSFYDSPTILRGWREENSDEAWKPRFEIAGTRILQNRGKFLKIRDDNWWQTNTNPYSDENNAIEWVDMDAYLESVINNNNLIRGSNGIAVSQVDGHDSQYTSVGLAHIQDALDGSICRKTTSNDLADIEWTLLNDIYPLLTSSSTSDGRYVVKGGGGRSEFLRSDGEWAAPEGTQYTEGDFIKISEGIIDVRANSANGSYYIRSDSGVLSWASAPENYPTLSQSDHNVGPYVINGCNNSSAAKFFLNGEGSWVEISGGGSGSTLYESGVGINIDNDNHINIDTSGSPNLGDVLTYDGEGGVEWTEPANSETIIDILAPVLKNTASVEWSGLASSNNPSISPEIWGVNSTNGGKYLRLKDSFDEGAGWGQNNNAIDWSDAIPNILMLLSIDFSNESIEITDNKIYKIVNEQRADSPDITLEYWKYYCITNVSKLVLSSPPANGNPLYIRIEDISPASIGVLSTDYIDINNCLSEINSSDILLTRLFGIDKLELIAHPSLS